MVKMTDTPNPIRRCRVLKAVATSRCFGPFGGLATVTG